MIQHILMWNYADEVSADEQSALMEELARLPESVPSLVDVTWGPVVGGRNQSFSHCFVMLFDDIAALEAYAKHPVHVQFAERFRSACSAQVVVNFEEALG